MASVELSPFLEQRDYDNLRLSPKHSVDPYMHFANPSHRFRIHGPQEVELTPGGYGSAPPAATSSNHRHEEASMVPPLVDTAEVCLWRWLAPSPHAVFYC